jgi:hypothetical protein
MTNTDDFEATKVDGGSMLTEDFAGEVITALLSVALVVRRR